jgi:uncharacterized membrane protein
VPRFANAQRRDQNEVEFARIVAFSDGVFAIAITLLVLGLSIPKHLHGESLAHALWGQRQSLFAYALSFAVIGRFWIIHHRFFADVVGFDGRLIAINLLYLAGIVLIPFSSQVLGDHGEQTAAIVLYATNLAGVTLIGLLMAVDARRAGLLNSEPAAVDALRRRSILIAAIFLGSIPVAFIDAGSAAYIWLAVFLVPTTRIFGRRS